MSQCDPEMEAQGRNGNWDLRSAPVEPICSWLIHNGYYWLMVNLFMVNLLIVNLFMVNLLMVDILMVNLLMVDLLMVNLLIVNLIMVITD